MEKLNDNLISGVVDASEIEGPAGPTSVSQNRESSQSDTTAMNSGEHSQTECRDTSFISKNEDIDVFFKKIVDRFADRLREAEERGFNRAVEMARVKKLEDQINASVPNFLADVRPDVREI